MILVEKLGSVLYICPENAKIEVKLRIAAFDMVFQIIYLRIIHLLNRKGIEDLEETFMIGNSYILLFRKFYAIYQLRKV